MTIRKATIHDAPAIATLLLSAMEEIVYGFIGKNSPEKALAFLFHFTQLESNQYSYQNCWVAEKNQRVVAAVNVYDGANLPELRRPVLALIQSAFQPAFHFEDETGPGEIYIDSLAVDPSVQGQGIGSALLAFLIEKSVKRRVQTLGLLVEEDNPAAKKLYLKLGFTVKAKKRIFNKNMEHLQITAGKKP